MFPSPFGGPYEINTCWQLITKTLKWESNPPITVHGFRSTLVDWCRANEFPEHLIKRQLDHVIGGKVDQAYGHDQHIEERRCMMRLWGDYCARPEPEPMTGTVVQMNGPRKKGEERMLIAKMEPLPTRPGSRRCAWPFE